VLKKDANGIPTYHFERLGVPGLQHAIFTRLGGVSQGPFATLNVGNSVGDDEAAVAENHARIFAQLGLSSRQVVSPHQVHGNHVVLVAGRDAGSRIPNTDGLLTATPGVALLLRFADCQPILLYDPAHHAVALVHAGWRGVAQGVARRAVEAMKASFDTNPQQLIAGLGPAIGPCCYTVGHNVAAAMGYALPDWTQVMSAEGEEVWRLDLSAANAQQLGAEGVSTIQQAGICTSCRRHEFYSHRGDGAQTGRFAVVTFLEPRSGAQHNSVAAPIRSQPSPDPLAQFDSLNPAGFPAFDEIQEGEL
jgi:YfiH family protein